ncbi:hypothetical protein Hanom_Chr10g00949301 [Helianthus anomalus]
MVTEIKYRRPRMPKKSCKTELRGNTWSATPKKEYRITRLTCKTCYCLKCFGGIHF